MRGAPPWWGTEARRRRSGSSRRPGCAKKASMRQGGRGTRVVQQGGWSTAKAGCSWPMPGAGAMPCWRGPSLCPKTGARMASAVRALASPRSPLVPQSPRERARGSRARSTRKCPQHGARALGSMGMIGAYGCGGRSAHTPRSGPSRARRMSGVAGSRTRAKRSWPRCLPMAGPGSVPARARRGSAGRRGVGCPWRSPCTPRGAGGCSDGGAWASPQTCRPTSCVLPTGGRGRRWDGSQAVGGPWRAALRRPKARSGWISMQSAVGRGGIGL